MSKALRNLLILAAVFTICYFISQGIESAETGERSRDVNEKTSYGVGINTVVLPHLNGEQLQQVDAPKEKSADGAATEKPKVSENNGFIMVDHPKLNQGHLMAMRYGEGKIAAEKIERIIEILKCKKCSEKNLEKDNTEAIVQILNDNVDANNNNNNSKRSLAIGRSQWRPGKRSTVTSRTDLGNGLDLITDANIHRFWKITKVSD